MSEKQALSLPKPNTRAFQDFKADLCEQVLKLKIRINKLTEQYDKMVEDLEQVFAIDDKQFFSEYGTIKKDVSNSYSIDESNVNKVVELLKGNNLTIDDYVTQKTSWGVTAKMRNLLNENKPIASELQKLVTVKTTERLSIKAS